MVRKTNQAAKKNTRHGTIICSETGPVCDPVWASMLKLGWWADTNTRPAQTHFTNSPTQFWRGVCLLQVCLEQLILDSRGFSLVHLARWGHRYQKHWRAKQLKRSKWKQNLTQQQQQQVFWFWRDKFLHLIDCSVSHVVLTGLNTKAVCHKLCLAMLAASTTLWMPRSSQSSPWPYTKMFPCIFAEALISKGSSLCKKYNTNTIQTMP